MEHSDIEFFNKNIDKINAKIDNYKEPQSKINRELVKELYLSGKKQIEIARHFNASKSTISDIIKSLKLK
jgi:DNA invertase Pin-like site-specific DNA recombinase